MPARMAKDPGAVLDYTFDWADWLGTDTITAHTVTASAAGVTVASSAVVGAAVVAWLTGGTAGTAATVTCHITTAAGRQDDRTLYLNIFQR